MVHLRARSSGWSALAETALAPAAHLVAALATPVTGSLHLTQVVQPSQATATKGQGSQSAQQNQPPPVYQPYPYQVQPGQAPPDAESGKLAQLKLLGELHDSGVLADDEFERQKQRILQNP